jgi:hypothetical protein
MKIAPSSEPLATAGGRCGRPGRKVLMQQNLVLAWPLYVLTMQPLL